MQYAIAKLHFRDPPSPESLGEGLVQVISSFYSRVVKLQFTARLFSLLSFHSNKKELPKATPFACYMGSPSLLKRGRGSR